MSNSNIAASFAFPVSEINSSADHFRRIAFGLADRGHVINIQPTRGFYVNPSVQEKYAEKVSSLVRNPPGIVVIHSGHPGYGVNDTMYDKRILFSHWETSKTPNQWIQIINENYEKLFVPNETTAESAKGIEIPITVIPPIFDFKELDNTKPIDISGVDENDFVFLGIGNWDNKANFTDLLISYFSTFSKYDRVVLVLKCNTTNSNNANERAKVLRRIEEIKGIVGKEILPKVVVLQDIFNDQAINSIIARSNCIVSSARGHCRANIITKGLYMGKFAIASDYAAVKDLNKKLPKNRLLRTIDFNLEPVVQMNNYYTCEDLWPHVNTSRLVEEMRSVYGDFFTKSFGKDIKSVKKALIEMFDTDKTLNLVEDELKKYNVSSLLTIVD